MGGLSDDPASAAPSDVLSLARCQAYIAWLEEQKGWDTASLERCCFLMGEEMGEVFGAVRRHDQRAAMDPDGARRAVAHELVDVMNYLLAIANRLEIDLESAFREKNTLNEARTWGTSRPPG